MSTSLKPLADTTASPHLVLSLYVSGNYSRSSAHLVIDALQIHRDNCNRAILEALANGDHESAFTFHQDLEGVTGLLDELLLNAVTLAARNAEAVDFATNPGGQRAFKAKLPADKQKRYESFLELVLPPQPSE